ncbi:MFS superfamily [Mycena chlorophos]|uniref:MFS superfamily n=1 Tax=Mycena chlorophos TaxID=658473 RepID=A0A8H6TN05_MYCCL|nr:MFS superfamily [Mycena chlorophos]
MSSPAMTPSSPSSSPRASERLPANAGGARPELFTHDLYFLPIPERLRYSEGKTFHLGIVLYLTMGFSSTFTVTNLYWCQPLLIELAKDFGVSYSEISRVPTLLQAGYAVGVVFISPLADLVRRRQLILLCLIASTALTVGLAVTANFVAFEVLSFLTAVASIVTTIMQPLAADIAPPHRRATAISVVISGLLLGVLVARVLAGILGQFSSWRGAYYVGVGTQAVAIVANYFLLPDYPAKGMNSGLTYPKILGTMLRFALTEPGLIQAMFISFCTSAAFTSFWVTLTFLLGGPIYGYDTLDIGLFGLVGMAGVLLGPPMGRIIDLLVPWYAALIALLGFMLFNVVQTAAGGVSVAAVAVVAFGLNLFRQMVQASFATVVLSISVEARGRLNAVNVLAIFMGQVAGTAAGTSIYLAHGWRICAAFSLALCAAQLLMLLVRGPHCERYTWVGWQSGWKPVAKPRREKPPRQPMSDSGEQRDIEAAGVEKSEEENPLAVEAQHVGVDDPDTTVVGHLKSEKDPTVERGDDQKQE